MKPTVKTRVLWCFLISLISLIPVTLFHVSFAAFSLAYSCVSLPLFTVVLCPTVPSTSKCEHFAQFNHMDRHIRVEQQIILFIWWATWSSCYFRLLFEALVAHSCTITQRDSSSHSQLYWMGSLEQCIKWTTGRKKKVKKTRKQRLSRQQQPVMPAYLTDPEQPNHHQVVCFYLLWFGLIQVRLRSGNCKVAGTYCEKKGLGAYTFYTNDKTDLGWNRRRRRSVHLRVTWMSRVRAK